MPVLVWGLRYLGRNTGLWDGGGVGAEFKAALELLVRSLPGTLAGRRTSQWGGGASGDHLSPLLFGSPTTSPIIIGPTSCHAAGSFVPLASAERQAVVAERLASIAAVSKRLQGPIPASICF